MVSHVELSDTRHLIGRGETLSKLKFPKFHVFDANWTLKLGAEWDSAARGHRISLKLSHDRRKIEDPWEMTAQIGFGIGENSGAEEVENLITCRFSHANYRLEIEKFDFLKDERCEKIKEKCGEVEIKVQVFIKILNSSGIQLRYFLDFSHQISFFSDATIRVGTQLFHVNRMVLSMASPVFFRHFSEKNEAEIGGEFLKDPHDFRRILNMIYPPHMVPKQWIKESCWKQQLADIYRILDIAKSLECGIAMETADEWIAKYGRFEIGHSIVLAQNFGLRRLMGSRIAAIESAADLHSCPEFPMFSQKTKALIFDHLITLL